MMGFAALYPSYAPRDQANITLADFRGAKVTAAQLDKACVWGDGQPMLDEKVARELSHKIRECQWDGQ
jgi:hypothetical protein